MKICSLNGCGLGNSCNYPDFIQLISEYDILCVLQSKLDKYDIIDIPGYT
jgi:hypothetical protein